MYRRDDCDDESSGIRLKVKGMSSRSNIEDLKRVFNGLVRVEDIYKKSRRCAYVELYSWYDNLIMIIIRTELCRSFI